MPKEQDDADAEQPGGASAETSHGGASAACLILTIKSDPMINRIRNPPSFDFSIHSTVVKHWILRNSSVFFCDSQLWYWTILTWQ